MFWSVLGSYISSSINIALPQIALEFALNSIFLGWIPTVYLLFTGIFLIPFGKIADIYGKKRVIAYGVIIFTVASFVSALAPNGDILLASRILQALGGVDDICKCLFSNCICFPWKREGMGFIFNRGSSLYWTFHRTCFGRIFNWILRWRSIFFFSIPFGIAAIIAVFELKREWTEAEQDRFSISSTVVFALALIGIIYGFSEITSNTGIIAFIGGSVGVVIFVWL